MNTKTERQTKLVDEYKENVTVDLSDNIVVSVGCFKLQQAKNTNIEHLNQDASLNDIRKNVKRDTIVIPEENASTIDDAGNYAYKKNDGGLAYALGDDIILPKYEIPDKLKKSLENSTDDRDKILAGDSMATISVYSHEITHVLHYRQNSGQNDTPYMSAVCSDVTEQLANFNQYMTYAHIWKNAKQAGVEDLTIDGKTMPVDNILDAYPGLKKEVTTNGFDETNFECRERIAKIASTYWNNERANKYAQQAQDSAKESQDYSVIGAIVNAREWEKRQKAMVNNLRTGDGVTYSAPECLKYFLPSQERTEMILKTANIESISNEQLLQLDKYMDKKGLATDEEKAQFIKDQMKYITYRETNNPKYDKEFADLLIEQSPPSHRQISYADGLVAKYDNDKVTISIGSESTTVSKASLENNNSTDKTIVHQEIKTQQGKYPPDAPTPELEATRALNNTKMTVAANKATKVHEQQQTKENKQPTRQTTLTTENIMALQAKQNSH